MLNLLILLPYNKISLLILFIFAINHKQIQNTQIQNFKFSLNFYQFFQISFFNFRGLKIFKKFFIIKNFFN